jgi:hypothetical protein
MSLSAMERTPGMHIRATIQSGPKFLTPPLTMMKASKPQLMASTETMKINA